MILNTLHGDGWIWFCDTVIGGTAEGHLFKMALVCGKSCTQEVFLKIYNIPTAPYCKIICWQLSARFWQCRIYFPIIQFGIILLLVIYFEYLVLEECENGGWASIIRRNLWPFKAVVAKTRLQRARSPPLAKPSRPNSWKLNAIICELFSIHEYASIWASCRYHCKTIKTYWGMFLANKFEGIWIYQIQRTIYQIVIN